MAATRAARCAFGAGVGAAALLASRRTATCAGGAPPPPDAAPAGRPTFQPCPEVSCKSKEELAALFSGGDDSAGYARPARRRRAPQPAGDGGGAAGAAAADAASAGPSGGDAPGPGASPVPARGGCPPAREELGAATWTFLHAVAAYYPERPSEEDKAAALGLVAALRTLYPCVHCRAQLAVDLDRLPPAVGSRAEFAGWVCAQHNLVNELLGKPLFPCTPAALEERWRTGRRGCWAPPEGGPGGSDDGAQTAEESLGQAE